MSNPLLTTKLYIPQPRPDLVPRPRLTERLNGGVRHKLTLISAPAGFGKTTLLSEWIDEIRNRVTWLSLDEAILERLAHENSSCSVPAQGTRSVTI